MLWVYNLQTTILVLPLQMESNDFGQSHSHRLNLLRKQLEKFFEVVLSRNYQMPVCHQQTKHKPPELEYTDFERELYQKNSSRVFVAVMDYDPHSLCKTGQPQLELPLQSGVCYRYHIILFFLQFHYRLHSHSYRRHA